MAEMTFEGKPFSRIRLLITVFFLASNITYFVLAPRIISIFNLLEPGGILIFPLTFFLADIITEVYGYQYSRYLVWCVIFLLGFFTLGTWASLHLEAAKTNYDYNQIFSHYPRLYIGISIATFMSFFLNNYILAKLKIRWQGKNFIWRSLISTAIGHAVFTAIWAVIFHFDKLTSQALAELILGMYLWKMMFELLATPLALFIAAALKSVEGYDIYDENTNFNPFAL